MHKYSIKNKSNGRIYFFIFVISVPIAKCFNEMIAIPLCEYIKSMNFTILNQIEMLMNASISLCVSTYLIFILIQWLTINYLWKMPIMKLLIRVPNISGNWDVNGSSEKYMDDNPIKKWEGTITIKQTMEEIAVILKTKQSKSYSITANMELVDETVRLVYCYENNPMKAERDMHRHIGTTVMEIDISNFSGEGKYYTDSDRKSYGVMNLKKVS